MLDQSFSAENFAKIFDDENRKGNDLASRFFPTVKKLNIEIRTQRDKLKQENDESKKDTLKAQLYQLIDKKAAELNSCFESLAAETAKKKYKINLEKSDVITSKSVYFTKKEDALGYFIIKQLQRNIRKLYKVKQSDRHQIVSQLSCLLNNEFPKHLIRTDIQEFYESIPHDKLLEIINHENLLSFASKEYIKSILNEYIKLSATEKGLPRGIGLSAYLAELFMRQFDRHIKDDGEVIFYARYVDDIVILYAPKPDSDTSGKLDKIRDIAKNNGLNINETKTKQFPLPANFKFDYLGYQFQSIKIGKSHQFTLDMSFKKLKKHIVRIKSSFTHYNQSESKQKLKARKQLVERVMFLTSNTKLYGNKSGTLIGIYFSNKLINKLERIEALDKYLTKKINTLKSVTLQVTLNKLSFKEGFNNKTFHKFSTQAIEKIVKVWG